MEKVVNCGHVAVLGIVTTGGYTLCYACCTEEDVQFQLPRREVMGVYVDERTRKVKNWPGGVLGDITEMSYDRRGVRYIRVTDAHGKKWHGRGSGERDAVTIRRSKTSE